MPCLPYPTPLTNSAKNDFYPQKSIPLTQKEFQVGNRKILAVYEASYELKIYECLGKERKLIFAYEIKYPPVTSGVEIVDILGDGNKQVAIRYCKKHSCPSPNGALAYDVATGQSYELEYDDFNGITLSANLAEEKNERIREWLLKWWHEWPSGETDRIRYKSP